MSNFLTQSLFDKSDLGQEFIVKAGRYVVIDPWFLIPEDDFEPALVKFKEQKFFPLQIIDNESILWFKGGSGGQEYYLDSKSESKARALLNQNDTLALDSGWVMVAPEAYAKKVLGDEFDDFLDSCAVAVEFATDGLICCDEGILLFNNMNHYFIDMNAEEIQDPDQLGDADSVESD